MDQQAPREARVGRSRSTTTAIICAIIWTICGFVLLWDGAQAMGAFMVMCSVTCSACCIVPVRSTKKSWIEREIDGDHKLVEHWVERYLADKISAEHLEKMVDYALREKYGPPLPPSRQPSLAPIPNRADTPPTKTGCVFENNVFVNYCLHKEPPFPHEESHTLYGR